MKQDYCTECFFDKRETLGCAAQQLKWALQNLAADIPLGKMIFKTEPGFCPFFEPNNAKDDI